MKNYLLGEKPAMEFTSGGCPPPPLAKKSIIIPREFFPFSGILRAPL
jgi:hypothetical protein